MQAKQERIPPLKVTRNTENNPLPVDAAEDELKRIEDELAARTAQLEQQREALAEQRRLAKEAEDARKLETYNNLREDAANFRASASKETDEASKKTYLKWAIDADRQALALARELGLAQPDTEATDPEQVATRNFAKHRKYAFMQAVILGFCLLTCVSCFIGYGDYIKEMNAENLRAHTMLAAQGKEVGTFQELNPYDETSLQKFFLEKFYQLADLPSAGLLMLLMCPLVLFYLLPFVRSRRDFITDFFDELTPFQRCVMAFLFLALFYLGSVLSHSVKP